MKGLHSNSTSQLAGDFIPDGNNAEIVEYRNLTTSDTETDAANVTSDEETEHT